MQPLTGKTTFASSRLNMQNNNRKLHLGCGGVIYPGWLNIDLDSPAADLHLDLTKPLPFADGTVEYIFNEHFIEHINRSDALLFLKDCRRVLVDVGVIRITTPNLRYIIACYLEGNREEWGDLWQPPSLCAMMNEGMREWGHQFVYDVDELVDLLLEAGFNDISFQEYRKSKDLELCNLESRPFHYELIVEARKMGGNDRVVDITTVVDQEKCWEPTFYKGMVDRCRSAETALREKTMYAEELEQKLADQVEYATGLAADLAALRSSVFGKAAAVWSHLSFRFKNK